MKCDLSNILADNSKNYVIARTFGNFRKFEFARNLGNFFTFN